MARDNKDIIEVLYIYSHDYAKITLRRAQIDLHNIYSQKKLDNTVEFKFSAPLDGMFEFTNENDVFTPIPKANVKKIHEWILHNMRNKLSNRTANKNVLERLDEINMIKEECENEIKKAISSYDKGIINLNDYIQFRKYKIEYINHLLDYLISTN